MQKTVKHTENYVGTFPQNAHVAQCEHCYDNNSDLLRRIKIVGDKWDHSESQELTQEWFQRKNMEYVPSEKVTCENGYTRIHNSFWICKAHSNDQDCDGDWEAWNVSGMGTIDTPTGTSEIIHTEILN